MVRKETMKQNRNSTGYLSALITILIWGTTFISTKLLLKDFAPVEILLYRFVIGFLALLAVYPKRMKTTDKKQELMFAAAGLFGITLYYLLENIALTYSMASNIGVIISVAPFFTGIIAHYFLDGEKLKANFFIGFVIAILGIILISYNGRTVFKLNPTGDLLAILAALVWAIYSVLTKKLSMFGYNTIQMTRKIFFYGIIFMLPAAFLFGFQLRPERFTSLVNLFNILFLGLGASAMCFVTWNYAVKLLGAMKTSVYIYMVPVITVITSILVLHEKITETAVFGTLLTLGGLIVSGSNLRLRKKAYDSLRE